MTYTGVLDIGTVESTDTTDIVAAFVNGECRGVARPTYIAGLKRSIVFLMVYSNVNKGDSVIFKIFDKSNGLTYNASNSEIFTNDSRLGTSDVPYHFQCIIPSSNTEIVSFGIAGTDAVAEINAMTKIISIELPFKTDITALVCEYVLSDGATAEIDATLQTSGETSNNFTDTVLYTVTAENTIVSQDWTVIISKTAPKKETAIMGFEFADQVAPAIIDAATHTVNIEIFASASIQDLIAQFTLSEGASAHVNNIVQTSGLSSNDFSDTVIFRIMAEDVAQTQDWKVVVKQILPRTDAEILSFAFDGQVADAVINNNDHTVAVEIYQSAPITSLIAEFSLSRSTTANINGTPQTSKTTANDFSAPVEFTVIAEDGITSQTWMITVTQSAEGNTDSQIEEFSLGSISIETIIDPVNHTIKVTVPEGTSVDSLVPEFKLPYGATVRLDDSVQASGQTANDFTDTLTYIVTAEDGITEQTWKVIVTGHIKYVYSNDADILSFTVNGQVGSTEINESEKRIMLKIAFDVDQTALIADFTASANTKVTINSVDQASGTTVNNFSDTLAYRVLAEDGVTEQIWHVVVIKMDEVIVSSKANIDDYVVNRQTKPALIDVDKKTITITVVFGTDLTTIKSYFTVSDGASATVNAKEQLSGKTANDFTDTVRYMVLAEDRITVATWNIVVVQAPEFTLNSDANILSFNIISSDEVGIVDADNKHILIPVAYGSDLSSMTATFFLSNGATAFVNTVKQESGMTKNSFSDTVRYKVVAEDGLASAIWSIIVSPAPAPVRDTATEILSFSLNTTGEIIKIDKSSKSVAVELPFGTNTNSLTATFTLSTGATASIGGFAQTSGVSSNKYTSALTYTILAEDTIAKSEWTVKVNVLKNTEAKVSSFELKSNNGVCMINPETKTIYINGDENMDLSSVIINFKTSANAVVTVNDKTQTSGITANDFRGTVIYKIFSEDGKTIEYWTVSADKLNATANETINNIAYNVYPTEISNGTATIISPIASSYKITTQSGKVIATGELTNGENQININTNTSGWMFVLIGEEVFPLNVK